MLPIMTGLCFGETTSAGASDGDYSAIPQAVRDFYSREVLFQAQPRLRFAQFAKFKRDLQAVRGKSIVFVKYGNLAGGGSLEESDVLTPEGMTTSEIIVPVKEQANSIQVTEYLLRTSLLDVLGDASKLLANNMAMVLDAQFRDTVLKTTNVVYGGDATSIEDIEAGDAFTTKTVKDAVTTHLVLMAIITFVSHTHISFDSFVMTRIGLTLTLIWVVASCTSVRLVCTRVACLSRLLRCQSLTLRVLLRSMVALAHSLRVTRQCSSEITHTLGVSLLM